MEQEYFASGTASDFTATSAPDNGRWSIEPTSSAFYRTRILVRRPIDPSRFNGTVVVEWMNVSEGESAPDWDYLNPRLMQAGYAYVAVSAQALGVNGGTAILGTAPTGGLIHLEPTRYGTLCTPGTSTRSTCSPRSDGHSVLRVRRPWVACAPGGSWPPVSPSRPST